MDMGAAKQDVDASSSADRAATATVAPSSAGVPSASPSSVSVDVGVTGSMAVAVVASAVPTTVMSSGGASPPSAAIVRVVATIDETQWKRLMPRHVRDELIDGMFHELRRITGRDNLVHLRNCAARYESLVWKRSTNQREYVSKLERRIQSLRRQPSQHEIASTASTNASTASNVSRTTVSVPVPTPSTSSSSASTSDSEGPSLRRSSRSSSEGKRSRHRHRSSTSSSSTTMSPGARDELYFARLRTMKSTYRDEVALVFRELCRVNTVIQNSASLRRHESNNLGDFLANLKKIIYLLEQQPDEMQGMIPQRKRTLEYLDVVESHIQRKVLPILYRLRHTYSTILRPLVLNYLRNSTRVSRRL